MMSALPPKADMCSALAHVRFGPIADIKNQICHASMFAFLVLISGPSSSQPSPPQAEWINALRNGGFVIVFRHGTTYQDQADTEPLNPKHIGSQRQLNDNGRSLAKSIGESLSKLRIPVGQVHTSLFHPALAT